MEIYRLLSSFYNIENNLLFYYSNIWYWFLAYSSCFYSNTYSLLIYYKSFSLSSSYLLSVDRLAAFIFITKYYGNYCFCIYNFILNIFLWIRPLTSTIALLFYYSIWKVVPQLLASRLMVSAIYSYNSDKFSK